MSEKSDTASSVQTFREDSSYSTGSFASSSKQQRYQKSTHKSQTMASNATNKVGLELE